MTGSREVNTTVRNITLDAMDIFGTVSKAVWLTKPVRRSIGVRLLQNGAGERSKWWTASATVAETRSCKKNFRNGSSRSPNTPNACSRVSTGLIGPSGSKRCSVIGSADPKAWRSIFAATDGDEEFKHSRFHDPRRIRFTASLISCSRPSIRSSPRSRLRKKKKRSTST